jgi:conjugative relaxase-like TrwC/TraI family protein
MITTTQIRKADAAVAYFGRELSASDYYLAEKGVWYGRGARILGLAPEVSKEDFVAIVNNQVPGSGQRLTARNNTTRTRIVWKLDEATQTKVPIQEKISNRRVCVDFTFSVPKSVSMYLARTKDAEVEKLIRQALRETLDDMEASIQTRVRIDDAEEDRSTANAIWACFVHRTTRPVSGKVDPHWHCHALLMNATFDAVENRWKAAQLGEVVASKGFYQAAFHSRVAEKLMAAGHRLRRTGKDFEMDVFTEEEVRVFCKRTKQIEDLEKRLRDELEKKVEASVRAAAKRGQLLDYEETYAAEKAKLGAEYREAKNQAKLQGTALEADWASQIAPGRWNAITPQASKLGHSIGFLDPETAQVQAVHHAFEQHSTIRETAMMTQLLKWGIGVIPVREAERFVQKSAAFLRNPARPGSITTEAIYREEKKILSMIEAGQGTLSPIDSGSSWRIQNEKIGRDPGQANAVRNVLGSTDLLTGIAGKPGVGKTTVIRETADAILALSGQEPMMLAATASAVGRLKEAGMVEATTVANFKDKSELQAAAAGRVIWCDEASLLDNASMTWLLNFARHNANRLVLSGDPRQHGAVQRGHPFKMAIETEVLPCAKLEKIYRQQNAPQLLEIIEDYYAQRYDAALQKIERLGLIRENNTRTDSLGQLVADVIEEFKRGQNPLVICPVHRDGKAFA